MADVDLHPVPENAYDASDPQQVEKQKRKEAIREKQNREVVAGLLSTPAGRNWMWGVLSDCHMFTNPYSTETHDTAFACGEMNIGQKLTAAIMRTSPDLYIQMLKERGDA